MPDAASIWAVHGRPTKIRSQPRMRDKKKKKKRDLLLEVTTTTQDERHDKLGDGDELAGSGPGTWTEPIDK